MLRLFNPWKSPIRMDLFHFMRRFAGGLTTDNHALHATWCSRLSSSIFEYDQDDLSKLRESKKAEYMKAKSGTVPTSTQIENLITASELSLHCRKKTRGVDQTKRLIQKLIDTMWNATDSTRLLLINKEKMIQVWNIQKKHRPCILDIDGVALYTKVGTLSKGGRQLDAIVQP